MNDRTSEMDKSTPYGIRSGRHAHAREVAATSAAATTGATGEIDTRHVFSMWQCGELNFFFLTLSPED